MAAELEEVEVEEVEEVAEVEEAEEAVHQAAAEAVHAGAATGERKAAARKADREARKVAAEETAQDAAAAAVTSPPAVTSRGRVRAAPQRLDASLLAAPQYERPNPNPKPNQYGTQSSARKGEHGSAREGKQAARRKEPALREEEQEEAGITTLATTPRPITGELQASTHSASKYSRSIGAHHADAAGCALRAMAILCTCVPCMQVKLGVPCGWMVSMTPRRARGV